MHYWCITGVMFYGGILTRVSLFYFWRITVASDNPMMYYRFITMAILGYYSSNTGLPPVYNWYNWCIHYWHNSVDSLVLLVWHGYITGVSLICY